MSHSSRFSLAILILPLLLFLNSCLPTGTSADLSADRASVPAASPPIQFVDAPVERQIPPHLSERARSLQTLFDSALLNQNVYRRYDTILLQWPDDLAIQGQLTIRIQTLAGRIFLERAFTAGPSAVARLGYAYVLPQGDYHVVLMPTPNDYYVEGLRIERSMAIGIESALP